MGTRPHCGRSASGTYSWTSEGNYHRHHPFDSGWGHRLLRPLFHPLHEADRTGNKLSLGLCRRLFLISDLTDPEIVHDSIVDAPRLQSLSRSIQLGLEPFGTSSDPARVPAVYLPDLNTSQTTLVRPGLGSCNNFLRLFLPWICGFRFLVTLGSRFCREESQLQALFFPQNATTISTDNSSTRSHSSKSSLPGQSFHSGRSASALRMIRGRASQMTPVRLRLDPFAVRILFFVFSFRVSTLSLSEYLYDISPHVQRSP
ncbi:hypothetical protein DFH06DRAFT_1128687 [Mycena polygramma]|nr:hypothetical protein DFH06DRAFT_1128687 [Mycena polygramma]